MENILSFIFKALLSLFRKQLSIRLLICFYEKKYNEIFHLVALLDLIKKEKIMF